MAGASPLYTVGARVLCNADQHLHVTMGFVGACDDARLAEICNVIGGTLAAHPLVFALGKHALFGPKNDVPVIQCELADSAAARTWQEFYTRYAQRPPGWTEPMNATQHYHVTVKSPAVVKELSGKGVIHCTHIFLKQLGPFDPYCNLPLPIA